MHLTIIKTKLSAILIVILMITSASLLAVQVRAQVATQGGTPQGTPNGSIPLPAGVTPDMQVNDVVVVVVSPHVVGIGQTVLINLWMEPPVALSRFITGYQLTITKPDGTKDAITLNSFQGDSTSYIVYTVDQVGTWKVDLTMPGAYFPAGNYTVAPGTSIVGAGGVPYTETFTRSFYYKPATAVQQTFTVQSAMVASWPPSPLPTDYWTRPVQFENREWAPILGDYPWWGPGGPLCPGGGQNWPADTNYYYSQYYAFTPWVQGPTSSHIVWDREGPLGGTSGIIGGAYGITGTQTGGGGPNIILQGRCYQTYSGVFPNSSGTPCTWWECYDLRTGQVFWNRPLIPANGIAPAETAPTYIEYSQAAESVPGAAASQGITYSLVAINAAANVPTYPGSNTLVYTSLTTPTPGTLVKYNPTSGAVTTNITLPLPELSNSMYYMNGYVLSVQTINTTGGPGLPGTPTAGIYRLINWTTLGTGAFSTRVVSNISWPRADIDGMGAYGMGSGAYIDGATGITFIVRESNFFDLVNMGSPYVAVQNNLNPLADLPASEADNASGIRLGTTIEAISLTTGKILWYKTVYDLSDPAGCSMYAGSADACDHGKLAILMRDGSYSFFDEYTGALLFKSQKMDGPWDITSFGVYGVGDAYGLLYRGGYGAYYAFNWTNGDIVWKFSAPALAPYEGPYTNVNGTGVYGWYGSSPMIADGKLYTYNSEHTATQPITRGWSFWCLNATTGQAIWNITTDGSPSAIADGYLSVSGTDGYQYVFGRGQSTTTISAPDTAVPVGTSVMIKGTVMDQSPAQPNTPCVSHESMKTQMEYLHKQQPIDGMWHNATITGVPVTLTAIGSDGIAISIGTTKTNGYYGTFAYTWSPPKEDSYTIVASFAGDDSYGSSSAATGLAVGPAQTTPATPEIPTPVDNTMLLYGIVVLVVIAIIIGIVALLRKR